LCIERRNTMPALFEKSAIKSMQLKNRLVRSATVERMGDDKGLPTENLTRLYERLAKGGVGLIITGMAYVSADGKGFPKGQSGIDRDESVDAWRDLTRHVHGLGTGVKIAMQIAHAGRQTTRAAIGVQPMAPSAVKDGSSFVTPREMTEDDIERTIEAFAQAARRVKESGFDAVQIHGGHGYLVNGFLNPYTNRRTDRWGGSLENRMRFVSEVYSRSRRLVGDEFPILIKISAYDHMILKGKKGIALDEAVITAEKLSAMGIDGIEASCGIAEDGMSTLRGRLPVDVLVEDLGMFKKSALMRFAIRHFGDRLMKTQPFTEDYNRAAARSIKQRVNVPVFAVGGIIRPSTMEDIVASGDADYISLSRSLIFSPIFPRKIQEGSREPSACIHCNHCLFYLGLEPLRCYNGKRIKK
jgi:2,4-dienoyl-CoA reductase-like NADH-dependent reductase (Old Yellow Enzyme family)